MQVQKIKGAWDEPLITLIPFKRSQTEFIKYTFYGETCHFGQETIWYLNIQKVSSTSLSQSMS